MLLVFGALLSIALIFFTGSDTGTAENVRTLSQSTPPNSGSSDSAGNRTIATDESVSRTSQNNMHERTSSREIFVAEHVELPLSGSAPTENVRHSIPVDDIRRGCFSQDCIPSVDDPDFISTTQAAEALSADSIGIALSYKNVERFYPFAMLVTREIVNDTVAGDPLLVTYCPLCGTGVVFARTVNGEAQEFGVSGMLWQSNLLMYNRAPDVGDRNLWSQVLGEAVVGDRTGTQLRIIPSDIMQFGTWRDAHPNGEVLDTGRTGDPYDGDYYGVAQNFDPDFDESTSPLPPSTYVYGIAVQGTHKAYPDHELPVGTTSDTVNGVSVTITKQESGEVRITDASREQIPDIEGFWFSWVAAHPETELWQK